MPRWTTAARAGRAVLLAIVAACVLGAIGSVLQHAWGWLVLLAVVAAVVTVLFVRDQRRMPYDGGLWLTPTRVVHRWAGRTDTLSWDDVVDVAVDPDAGGAAVAGRISRVLVSPHLLVMSAPAVVMLVDALRDHPARRRLLGEEASLHEAEEVRDLVDRDDFSPVVTGAPRPSAGLMSAVVGVVIALLLGLAALGRVGS